MFPTLVKIGNFEITTFGVMVALGNSGEGGETATEELRNWGAFLRAYRSQSWDACEMLLVKLGMVSQQQLREARRYVFVGAFVVAAVLTVVLPPWLPLMSKRLLPAASQRSSVSTVK